MQDVDQAQYWKLYYESFIRPADPYRFNTETKAIPRVRDLYQVNLKADIARGWRAVMRPSMICGLRLLHPDERERLFDISEESRLRERDEDGEPWFYRQSLRHYRRLDSCNEQTGRPYWINHFFRKARSAQSHLKWYLVQHDRKAMVNYLQFDLDMHDGSTPESEAKLLANVDRINKVVSALGGEVVWTTSPGDMFGGKHVQGLYAWIKLDDFHEVGHLIDIKKKIKQIFELPLDTEFSWDNAYRAIRPGGQQWVEVVNPHTSQLLAPVGEKEPQRKAFNTFCQNWYHAKPISLEALLALAPEEPLPVIQQEEVIIPSELLPTRKPVFQDGIDLANVNLDPANTWKRALSVASYAMHKSQGCADHAKHEVTRLLPEVSPSTSRTCSDPGFLNSMASRIVDHFSANFNPINQRRSKDKQRYLEHTVEADTEDIIKILSKHLPLTGIKNKLRRFLDSMKSYTGRIACGTIYDDPDAIFQKREWFKLNGRFMDCLFFEPLDEDHHRRKVLSDFICVVDGYSPAESKCRQYGFSGLLLRALNELQETRKRTKVLVEAVEGEDNPRSSIVSISRTPGLTLSLPGHNMKHAPDGSGGFMVKKRKNRWNTSLPCLSDL